MSKHRQAARTDSNQSDIIDTLRKIPGVTVQPSMDDILVGRLGVNYWFEIKTPDCVSTKTGLILESKIKYSQKKLRKEWKGQYNIVSTIEEILEIINGR